MKKFLKIGATLAVFLFVSLAFIRIVYPGMLEKSNQASNVTVKMDENQIYAQDHWRISFVEGVVVLSSEQENQDVLHYTDFLFPQMAVCENHIAIFESPASHFYLLNLQDKTFKKIETDIPLLSLKLSAAGDVLAISHSGTSVYLLDQMGKLKFQLKTKLLLCDAAVSQNGKRVGLLFFSDKKANGYFAEIYSATSGKRLSYANLIYDEIPLCFMHKNRLCLKKDDQILGFFWFGKFYLFPQNT